MACNNMLQVAAGTSLYDFRLHEDLAHRPDASAWRTLTLVIDQGSDGWGAGWFLRHKQLCVNVLKDPLHRQWNNSQLALRDARLWPFVQIMCIVFGCDAGPWQDSAWFQQGREGVEQYMKVASYQDCPLFAELLVPILRDCGEEGRACEPHIAEEIWETLPDVWAKKCQRVPTTRWFGFVNACREFHPQWHRRLLTMQFIMLALNMKVATKPHEILKSKLDKLSPDADPSKHRVGQDTNEASTLRKSCTHALELVEVVLSDQTAQLLADGICYFLEPPPPPPRCVQRESQEVAVGGRQLGLVHTPCLWRGA